MSHNNFSQQFPSPPDNESVYHTPPEYLFPIFPNENEPQNTPPADLFPVFPNENQPQNTPPEVLFPPANTPPVDLQNNPFNFSEEYLRQLEQDMEVFREFEQAEAQEAAARRERERREAEYRWEMGLNPQDS